MEVFGKSFSLLCTLSTPDSLLSDFKLQLWKLVSRCRVEDRLVLLIFVHGDSEEGTSGILVGSGDQEGFGVLHSTKLNFILEPCVAQVTLITLPYFGGNWVDVSQMTYATVDKCQEMLSVPMSASRAYRGGYFWEAMFYELNRLGMRNTGSM